jgi:xylulokinase
LADLTGSRAYERFTGPQIRHIYKNEPEIYKNTERISLISSFLASLMVGFYAPIDLSDGSGMNLLDINTHQWNETLLDLTAPNLKDKLDLPIPSNHKISSIASFWCDKYGFSSDCEIYAFSGDNPCSLIGLNLNQIGDIGLSLGTSDVLFAVTNEPKPNANEGSILIHPQNKNNYMMMLVYKNGATTRNYIKNSLNNHNNNKDWTDFNRAICETPVGNDENISFYYIESEITPTINGNGIVRFNKNDEEINDDSNENRKQKINDCRGIIESQILSFKYHAQLLGLNKIRSITVTGGGSVNEQILQIIADIFEIEVKASEAVNTAASGAAIRALNSFNDCERLKMEEFNTFFNNSQPPHNEKNKKITQPNEDNFPIYRRLFERYGKLESLAVHKLNNNFINRF